MQTGQLYPTSTPYGFGQPITLEFTTEPIADGSTVDLALETPAAYEILTLATSHPAWVRLYGSALGRDMDDRLDPGAPFPDPGTGFFLEVQTQIGNLLTSLSPTTGVQVEVNQSFFRIRNDSGDTAAITITLQVQIGSYAPAPAIPPYNCNVFVNTAGRASLASAWQNCTNITQLPLLNLNSVNNLSSAWQGCINLQFVPQGLFDNCPATDLTNTFVNCSLTETSVDNILISLDTAGQSNGRVDITGGNNAPPSVAGDNAKANLEGKGWIVNVATTPVPLPLEQPSPQLYPILSPPIPNAVISDPEGITGASQVKNVVSLSQADYNNIISPDPETLYLIY